MKKSSSLRILLFWTTIQLLFVFVLFNAGNWYLFNKIKKSVDDELGKTLLNYAVFISDRVEDFLLPGEPVELAIYQNKLEQVFDRLAIQMGLSNLAILDTLGETIYSFDRTVPISEKYSYILLDRTAFESAKNGVGAYTELYEKRGRFLKGAFYPLTEPSGNVVGIVSIEAGSDFFLLLGLIKKYALTLTILTVFSIILLGLLFVLVLIKFRQSEESTRRSITLATMGEMASLMAHEIKNPLAIIRAVAERIEPKLSSESAEMVSFIKEEVDRLNGLVQGYLSLTRPLSNEFYRGRVSDVINVVLRYIRDEFAKSGIKITAEIVDDPEFEFAPDALRQALLNLFFNARDAMPGGGSVSLRVYKEKIKNEEYLSIAVTDTGIGIPEKDRKRIFEPFYSTKEGGSGLGLYVVRRIMEEHGGRVSVSSIEDLGTTFVLSFPTGKKQEPKSG